MSDNAADALVFFGATGDLAAKQIFPALQAMVRRGRLTIPVIGVAGSKLSLDDFKGRVRTSLEQHGGVDEAAFDKLCSLLSYVGGDYAEASTYVELRRVLGASQHPLHYLAIPPSFFARVAEGLSKNGCANGGRVVVEKPFGRDLASAQALNATLLSCFPEESIFRIDHYLGKEPVQDLLYFRFANPLVKAGWDRNSIDSVQITMAENFGVAGRGKFYEEAGALRDVVQNHMLEVIACLAMECPDGADHAARRDQRSKLLEAVRTLQPGDVIRGQFEGYHAEPGVAADSTIETFAAVRFSIDNERWSGVPFYVRAGKCLPVTATEIVLRFKSNSAPVLDEAAPSPANYYRFQISPSVVIAMGTNVKKPGELMQGESVELVCHHQVPDEMAPYERLLSDAAHGDPTLFAREDAVEASWRIVDPILGNVVPLQPYAPGTWGPGGDIVPPGGWQNPAATPA